MGSRLLWLADRRNEMEPLVMGTEESKTKPECPLESADSHFRSLLRMRIRAPSQRYQAPLPAGVALSGPRYDRETFPANFLWITAARNRIRVSIENLKPKAFAVGSSASSPKWFHSVAGNRGWGRKAEGELKRPHASRVETPGTYSFTSKHAAPVVFNRDRYWSARSSSSLRPRIRKWFAAPPTP